MSAIEIKYQIVTDIKNLQNTEEHKFAELPRFPRIGEKIMIPEDRLITQELEGLHRPLNVFEIVDIIYVDGLQDNYPAGDYYKIILIVK